MKSVSPMGHKSLFRELNQDLMGKEREQLELPEWKTAVDINVRHRISGLFKE